MSVKNRHMHGMAAHGSAAQRTGASLRTDMSAARHTKKDVAPFPKPHENDSSSAPPGVVGPCADPSGLVQAA
jgi:hypothetical protein